MKFTSSKPNKFDNLIINVPALYKKFPINSKSFDSVQAPQQEIRIFNKLYNLHFLPLSVGNALWYMLHRTGLDSAWFDDFKKYWSHVLEGITLWGPEDFYFLRNIYRLKFQYLSVPESKNPSEHLKAWQKPEVLYQLLDMVYRQSLFNQINAIQLYLKYRRDSSAPIWEFGCGTAPVTTSLFEFLNPRMRIYISDIETIFFHYASFRFRSKKNVFPVLLRPEDKFYPSMAQKLGAIFCMTVFEHLDRPLEVAKKFWQDLEPEGILIFDYIKSDGKGMDTKISLKERSKVLDFIASNFNILHGDVHLDSKEAKTIVAQKK